MKENKEVEPFCCGNCAWYDGDMEDTMPQFCNEKEDYVSKNFYCYKYKNMEEI